MSARPPNTPAPDAPAAEQPRAGLRADRPGPIDRLTREQRARYGAAYGATAGSPAEKHAPGWRAALAGPTDSAAGGTRP